MRAEAVRCAGLGRRLRRVIPDIVLVLGVLNCSCDGEQ